jgi:hypothetical protein
LLLLDDDDFVARLPLEDERPEELRVAELPFRIVVRAVLPAELPELLEAADPEERTPVVMPVPEGGREGILVGRSARLRVRAVFVSR